MAANVLLQSALNAISAFTEDDIKAAMEALGHEKIVFEKTDSHVVLSVPALDLIVGGRTIEEAAKNLLREYLYQYKSLKSV